MTIPPIEPAPRTTDTKHNQDITALLEALDELLCLGISCTCCGQSARKQCEDHDDGYGVCDKCLAEYGRDSFCHIQSCTAHN
jgi:hypothetical protein